MASAELAKATGEPPWQVRYLIVEGLIPGLAGSRSPYLPQLLNPHSQQVGSASALETASDRIAARFAHMTLGAAAKAIQKCAAQATDWSRQSSLSDRHGNWTVRSLGWTRSAITILNNCPVSGA